MKKLSQKYILTFLLFGVNYSLLSQDSLQTTSTTQIGLYSIFSPNTPFWLRANQYATIPNKSSISVMGSHLFNRYLKNSNWQIGGGMNIVANINTKSQFILPELYGKIQYKKWELYAGRRKEVYGLADTTLGLGSFIWSGNALTIPKIQLGVIDYTPIKFTKGLLSFKGNYAHGWFGSGNFAYGVMLHQKSLYLKIGKLHWITNFYAGFNHQVQWGGRTSIDIGTVNDRHLPSSFKDYLFVITGSGGLLGPSGSNNPFDSTNRVGNHLGTIDVGMTIELPKYSFFLYRQSIYEDGSLYYLINVTDGLNGFSLKRVAINKQKNKFIFGGINIEYLDTRSQGGPVAGIGSPQWGKDNYFNHAQYYDGWTYRGTIIGTPFFTRQSDTKREEPFAVPEATNNNRITVFHIGSNGYFGTHTTWKTKLSWSNNLGTYDFPYPNVKQFSGLIQIDGAMGKDKTWKWTTAVAWDKGQLYQNSVGFQIGVRKVWNKLKYRRIVLVSPTE